MFLVVVVDISPSVVGAWSAGSPPNTPIQIIMLKGNPFAVLEAGGNANAQINNAKESSVASNSSSASKKKSKNKKKLSNSSISSSVSANGGLGSGVINPFVNAPAQHLHTQPSPQASSHSQLEEDARLAWQLQQQMQVRKSPRFKDHPCFSATPQGLWFFFMSTPF